LVAHAQTAGKIDAGTGWTRLGGLQAGCSRALAVLRGHWPFECSLFNAQNKLLCIPWSLLFSSLIDNPLFNNFTAFLDACSDDFAAAFRGVYSCRSGPGIFAYLYNFNGWFQIAPAAHPFLTEIHIGQVRLCDCVFENLMTSFEPAAISQVAIPT